MNFHEYSNALKFIHVQVHSKSFKQIYIEWIYEKYLRNIELEKVEALFHEQNSYFACGMRHGPPLYPIRPAGKHHFVPVGGFKEHPNESETM